MSKFLDALLLQPLALIWALLVLVTLWRLAHRKWRAALGPALLATVIYAIGATKLSAHLLATLERPYAGVAAATLPPADAVVVLGGMSGFSSNDVFNLNLGQPADRIVAGMELVRLKKGRALVIGGGGPPAGSPQPAEGELLLRWATNWNVFRAPVYLLGRCAHTQEEAQRARALAEQQGWKRLILVTSASHMRRAEAVFRRAGLEVTPFACDFEGLSSLEREDPHFRPLPGPGGFEGLSAYLHEIVGWWVYRWRGWL